MGEAGSTFDDTADDLVAEDERELRIEQLPVTDMQVGATNAARAHGNADVVCAEIRLAQRHAAQRPARPIQDHREHATTPEIVESTAAVTPGRGGFSGSAPARASDTETRLVMRISFPLLKTSRGCFEAVRSASVVTHNPGASARRVVARS